MSNKIYRIIDANFNRSREGLRVCEDIARFILNSPTLTKELKSVRHKISEIARTSRAGSKMLFKYRDVEGDVGKRASAKVEMKKVDCIDIFSANIERVKESLRTLEEFFKLIDKRTSVKFSHLRFKIYDIEKRAVKRLSALPR